MWTFCDPNALEGWELPDLLEPAIQGGCLRIRPRAVSKPGEPVLFAGLNTKAPLIGTPAGLDLDRAGGAKLRIRLLNHSPETDIRVWISTLERPEEKCGPVSIAMRPYDPDWQELTGHLDELDWQGTRLDRVWLQFPNGQAGDVFVRSVSVTPGEARPIPERPDILNGAVPRLTLGDIQQADFEDAFAVLSEAVVHDPLPINGFPVPFLAPGAGGAFYGNNWWVLDASLAMHPLVWTAPRFCTDMMLGFCDVMDNNPDGCLQHEGKIARRGIPCDCSVIPRVFEAWYACARISDDAGVRERIYRHMAEHLSWWLSPVKRDPATGLVRSIFEESFTCHGQWPGGKAGVDTNAAVAVGARLCSELAAELGRAEEAALHQNQFDSMAASINRWLWNEEHGCYQNWLFDENRHMDVLASHMFDPLRFGIAAKERRERLFERLFDPDQFGWGKMALTTIARQDPQFVIALGPYDGKGWNGDIWTMRNHPVIQGLRECGEYERAAQLAWHTVQLFAGNWAEYLEPDGGTGQGVERYAWTAGQWLQIIFEEIFGLQWHRQSQCLQVNPLIPEELTGRTIALNGVHLPDGRTVFDVRARRSEDGQMKVDIKAKAVPDNYVLNICGTHKRWQNE